MKNIKEANQIDWHDIFVLEEFIAYFDIKLLKEFSLTSQLVRNRLKAKLFANSALIGSELLNYFDMNSLSKAQVDQINTFTENFECDYGNQEITDDINHQLLNNSELNLLAKDLKRELQRISRFIKSIKVVSLTYDFYDLYSIAFTLNNLDHLELYNCTVPLLKFMKIGKYLKNLVKLTLWNVRFIEFAKQELSPEMLDFPNTFNLNIDDCDIHLMNSVPNAANLFRSEYDYEYFMPEDIQGFDFPNLKTIEYNVDDYSDYLFFAFIKSSPHVETLIIDKFLPNQRDYNQISISKHLTNLEIYCANTYFPHISHNPDFIFPRFDSVNKLMLEFSGGGYNQNIYDPDYRNITKYFSNLTHLTINLFGIDCKGCNFGKFFEANLPFCNTLEVLTIVDYKCGFEASNYYGYKFNFENFANVKCLILDLDAIPLSEINFNNLPSELKQVRKFYCDKQYQLNYIRDNPENFKNWNIEFKDRFIYFTK